MAPLLTGHPPDVTFAAARAGAFIGDPTGASQTTLLEIARTADHPFQLNAVQVLGALPPSGSIDAMLRQLLDSDKTLVRIEAYKILARNEDRSVYSRVITDDPNPANRKFILDIVPSKGAPLLYATRSGKPRIAVIGDTPRLTLPILYTAMGNRLSISSQQVGDKVTLFYRDPLRPLPVKVSSEPDIAEVIARLGGMGRLNEEHLDFGYDQVLAIVQALVKEKQVATVRDGELAAAPLIIQESPRSREAILSAPLMDGGRPQQPERPRTGRLNPPPEAEMVGRAR
jgi:hypothetical protein